MVFYLSGSFHGKPFLVKSFQPVFAPVTEFFEIIVVNDGNIECKGVLGMFKNYSVEIMKILVRSTYSLVVDFEFTYI